LAEFFSQRISIKELLFGLLVTRRTKRMEQNFLESGRVAWVENFRDNVVILFQEKVDIFLR